MCKRTRLLYTCVSCHHVRRVRGMFYTFACIADTHRWSTSHLTFRMSTLSNCQTHHLTSTSLPCRLRIHECLALLTVLYDLTIVQNYSCWIFFKLLIILKNLFRNIGERWSLNKRSWISFDKSYSVKLYRRRITDYDKKIFIFAKNSAIHKQ